MSSLGTLSHSYSEMARLAETLTDAVATLFRAHEEGMCEEDDRRAALRLVPLVRALRNQLHGGEPDTDADESMLPPQYVARIREARRGDLAYLGQDLDELASLLDRWEGKLSDGAIGTLRLVTRTASDQAASLYRRLRRH